MTEKRLAVLAFHKVGEPSPGGYPTWNYIATERFASALATLAELGWEAIDAGRFVGSLNAPGLLPDRAALITFDDGYRSTLTEALPVLRRFGFPAVVFVPTAYVGGTNAFDAGIEPEEPMCTWEELAELERNGIAVEAHSRSHPQLSELNECELHDELAGSKYELECRLSKSVTLLAYPYGNDRNPLLTREFLASLGYRASFLYGGGLVEPAGMDSYRISRLAIGPDSDLAKMLAIV